ncbi:MAG TPA: hypothetical protein VGM19_00820 [Armatimonadota bacterium]
MHRFCVVLLAVALAVIVSGIRPVAAGLVDVATTTVTVDEYAAVTVRAPEGGIVLQGTGPYTGSAPLDIVCNFPYTLNAYWMGEGWTPSTDAAVVSYTIDHPEQPTSTGSLTVTVTPGGVGGSTPTGGPSAPKATGSTEVSVPNAGHGTVGIAIISSF